jgi:NADPH:quinone reductase
MHAIVIREAGGPEVLKLEEVPDPEPGEGQVLGARRGRCRQPLRHQPAPRSSRDRRLATVHTGGRRGRNTGRYRPARPRHRGAGRLRRATGGAGGERSADSRLARQRPGSRPRCGLQDRLGLPRRRRPRARRHAARPGRIERHRQAAIDIGRHLGATVFATGSESKLDRLRELGAEPLAYDDERVAQLQAAVVFDPVGGSVFERSLAASGLARLERSPAEPRPAPTVAIVTATRAVVKRVRMTLLLFWFWGGLDDAECPYGSYEAAR